MASSKNVVLDDALRVGGNGKREVAKNLTEKVGESLSQRITDDFTQTVGRTRNITVTVMDKLNVIGTRNTTVMLDDTARCNAKRTISAKYRVEKADETMEIDIGKKLTLKCGDASITIEEGVITLKGKQVVVDGSQDVTVKGGKIFLN